MALATRKAIESVVKLLPGIRSIRLELIDIGTSVMHIKFKFWTALIPCCKQKALQRVNQLVHDLIPFNMYITIEEE
jgi:hypothetical protein